MNDKQTKAGGAGTETVDEDRARALTEVLRDAGELGSEERVTEVSQLSGGWSRHSYVAKAQSATGEPRSFIVRVEAPGGVLETDIAAEYALYHALDGEADIATPSVYYFDDSSENAFGNRFMVMDHMPGTAANAFRRPDRQWLQDDWNGPRGIAPDMVENLARLHSFPVQRLPAGAVPELEYLDVVDRWQTVYEEKHLVRDPVTEEAFVWLRARVPADTQRGVVHGDYRIGNALVHEGRVSALLDWELAYVGDVRFDVGYLALERLAGKHLRPATTLLNAFAEADWFFAEYARLTGRPLDPEVVRTFSVLAIMMLLSTHYMGIWMYAHGRSTDFRLAWNRFGVIGLRQDLTSLMQW
jgi:aminoglycoside phosphotransferase (APT) family kinase protein